MAAEAVVVAAVPAPAGDLGALVAGWLLGFRSTNTRDAYRRDIAGWLIFCAANSLDPLTARRPHANAWACTLDAAGLKPSTIARRLSAVASWYAWLAAEEVITYSPMAHVRRPKVSDESATLGPDRDEARRLLDTASRLGRVPAALVSLLLLNGCRVSEVVGANIEDLDTEQGHRVLHVTRKGGRAALIPLAPRTAAALDALIGARTAGPIFQGRGRERLGRTGANYILNRVANAAGIDKHLSPHSLRHGFVTLSLEVGATLTDVQDAAGHADPRDAMTGPGIGWTMHRPTPSPTRSGALLSQAHGRMWGRRDSPAVGESLAGDEAERGRHHERKPSRTCGTRRRSENHPRGSGAPSPRKRKGHAMKGTTRKRGATWSYQFTVTRAGRRHHVTKGGFRTQKLAQDALTDAMAERRSGAHVEPTRLTLADYLRRQWLPVVQISRKPGTLRSYRDIMENRVIPALGDIRLSEVSAGDVAGLYAQLRISGKRTGGGGGLSERSIKAIQTALMAALPHAVEGGLIAVNPVRQLPKDARPTPRRTEIRTWTGEDLRAFLAASADDRYHTAYTLAAVTGSFAGFAGPTWTPNTAGSRVAEPGRLCPTRLRKVPRKPGRPGLSLSIRRPWRYSNATGRPSFANGWHGPARARTLDTFSLARTARRFTRRV